MIKLNLFTNGIDFVIAENQKEAEEICAIQYGYELPISKDDREDQYGDNGWSIYPEDENFTYTDESTIPEIRETKKAKEWISSFGKGYFASTEY